MEAHRTFTHLNVCWTIFFIDSTLQNLVREKFAQHLYDPLLLSLIRKHAIPVCSSPDRRLSQTIIEVSPYQFLASINGNPDLRIGHTRFPDVIEDAVIGPLSHYCIHMRRNGQDFGAVIYEFIHT
jgi:hypothetical protein